MQDTNDTQKEELAQSNEQSSQQEKQQLLQGIVTPSPVGAIICLVCFLLLVADAITATVLLIKGKYVGCIVCVVILAVVLISGLVISFISNIIAMKGDIRHAKKILCGTVKSCETAGMSNSKSNSSVTTQSLDYKIVATAEDGLDYVAISQQQYETDEPVIIAVMGKKKAKLVTEDDIKRLTEPKKPEGMPTAGPNIHHHYHHHHSHHHH